MAGIEAAGMASHEVAPQTPPNPESTLKSKFSFYGRRVAAVATVVATYTLSFYAAAYICKAIGAYNNPQAYDSDGQYLSIYERGYQRTSEIEQLAYYLEEGAKLPFSIIYNIWSDPLYGTGFLALLYRCRRLFDK
ncbi:hypothetical protein EOPP23_21100 [Endozoicomonas sp. OPT23]|uniref:hypothetical protein n=1 Tax=Endozoicomonas sp. OPT23 TaxID=2072845 RepID=UPI00129C0146|nr:hypothetical protein [Endozoicomonas sp. OPT23]MRI35462.1 hypothetical protein [Endozoicomonas sp. OPT23]